MRDKQNPEDYGFTWEENGTAIRKQDWNFISYVANQIHIESQGDLYVLEFGSGLSTCLFSEIAQDIVSYETDQAWVDKIKSLRLLNTQVYHGMFNDLIPSPGKFNLAFVDGPFDVAHR